MRLITWNIQWGKGCDGVVDLARIVATAKAMADADVFCFQEVSNCFADLDGGVDQSAALAALLPDYRAVFRAAVETVDDECKTHGFGNMTLSRLPVLQIASHLLPWPRGRERRSMRRLALEVTVQAAFGPVRIVNTHLEYYSAAAREAQIMRLLDLQEEACARPAPSGSSHVEPYAAQIVTQSSVLCGDFNFDVSNPQYALLHAASRAGQKYRDAWTVARPDQPHQATCGIHDHVQWKSGPDCRDFIFITEDLAGRVRRVEVDRDTSASDHQPILLEIEE